MKKKVFKFLACMALIPTLAFSSMLTLSSCGNNGSNSQSNQTQSDSSANKKYSYMINGNSITLETGEVGEMYVFPTPEVVDKGGQVVSTMKPKVGTLLDANGQKQVVAAGRFTPKSIGEFTVTYTCNNDDVKELTLKFTVGDTVAPTIDASQVPATLFLSDENSKPDFKAKDVGGVDEASKQVKLFAASGSEISYSNDKFNLTDEGVYTYKFEVQDQSGNKATAEKQVFVSASQKVEGQVTYLTAQSYNMQVANKHDVALTYNWSTEHKDPDGGETLEVTTDTIYQLQLTYSCAVTDWSEYDYIGFWVYNPTDIYLAVGFASVDTLSYVLNPKAWTYACFNFNVSFLDANRNPMPVDNRPEMVLEIGDRFTMDNTEATETIPTGSQFYISNFRLYKDTSDNVFSLGEKYGYYQQSIHQKYMEYSVELSNEVVQDGDSYSTKFTMVNIKNSFNVALYSEKNCPSEDYYVFLNVYNANDYEVAFIDVSCDGFAEIIDNGNGNLSTVIPANSWGKVLCKVDWDATDGRLYIMALLPDGSEVKNGAVFYFGNSEIDDIYTGDVSNWNEEHGVVGLYEKFKKKNPVISQ